MMIFNWIILTFIQLSSSIGFFWLEFTMESQHESSMRYHISAPQVPL